MADQVIVHGDCREVFADVELDVLVADPPYSRHVHEAATSHGKKDALNEKRRGTRKRELGFEYLTPSLRRWVSQLAARTKRWSLIYSDWESIGWWRISLEAAGAHYIRTVPWTRWSMPQLSGDRPPSGSEAMIIAYGSKRGRKSWNGPGDLTHLDHACLRGEEKHKAEKPLDQALDLVSWFSNDGECVGIPFSGSGTFELACRILDRDCRGAEALEQWAEHGGTRLRANLIDRDKERLERWRCSVDERERKRLEVETSEQRKETRRGLEKRQLKMFEAQS